MYLKKNKKGFTLIELMVVVAIIGVLALLGLRLYTGQQDKAKEAIVKANAGTVQTLIQSEMADGSVSQARALEVAQGASLHNPFKGVAMQSGDFIAGSAAPSGTAGQIYIREIESGVWYEITGIGGKDEPIKETLTAKR